MGRSSGSGMGAPYQGKSSSNGRGYFTVLRLGLCPLDLLAGRACFTRFGRSGATVLANSAGSVSASRSPMSTRTSGSR